MAQIRNDNTHHRTTDQVSAAWHDEILYSAVIHMGRKRMLNNSSCAWTQFCARLIRMLFFLERGAELNPPTRAHRSMFEFHNRHIGYKETW